jgi:CheY-like chemotaxis protein
MDGEIGFASHVGEGSTFWVDIPVAPEAAPRMRVQTTSTVASGDIRPKILYIEDKAPNVELMRSILESWTHLLEARSVAEGIRIARLFKPDLVITDIHLPDGKGFDVLERLRCDVDTRHIPIAALTADAMRENIDRMRRAGFDSVLTKPFKIAAITELVRAATRNQTH